MRSAASSLRLAFVAAVVLVASLASAAEASASYDLIKQWGSYGNADGQFIRPVSLAVDPAGNVYVTDTDPGSSPMGAPSSRVQKFDHDGNFISSWGGTGTAEGKLKDPNGIAIDGSGNVYVAENQNHRVSVFTSNGQFLRMFGWGVSDGVTNAVQVCTGGCHAGIAGSGPGQYSFPSGIAIKPDGNLYVTSFSGSVQQVTPNGAFVGGHSTSGTAEGVGIASSGNVYVAIYGGSSAVDMFNASLNPISSFGADDSGSGDGHFTQVPDVVVSPQGTVFVVDRLGGRVQLFDLDGQFESKFTTFAANYGIALDCRGNVFVAGSGGTVAEYGDPAIPFKSCVPESGGASDTTAPSISKLAISNRKFAVDSKAASARVTKKVPRGTTFAYSLSEPATVTFTIDRKTSGRKSGKNCVKKTKRNARRRKCTLYVKAGSFTQAGVAGADKKPFSGKIAGRKLRAASYRATLTATDAAKNASKAATVSFKIVKASKRKQ